MMKRNQSNGGIIPGRSQRQHGPSSRIDVDDGGENIKINEKDNLRGMAKNHRSQQKRRQTQPDDDSTSSYPGAIHIPGRPTNMTTINNIDSPQTTRGTVPSTGSAAVAPLSQKGASDDDDSLTNIPPGFFSVPGALPIRGMGPETAGSIQYSIGGPPPPPPPEPHLASAELVDEDAERQRVEKLEAHKKKIHGLAIASFVVIGIGVAMGCISGFYTGSSYDVDENVDWERDVDIARATGSIGTMLVILSVPFMYCAARSYKKKRNTKGIPCCMATSWIAYVVTILNDIRLVTAGLDVVTPGDVYTAAITSTLPWVLMTIHAEASRRQNVVVAE